MARPHDSAVLRGQKAIEFQDRALRRIKSLWADVFEENSQRAPTRDDAAEMLDLTLVGFKKALGRYGLQWGTLKANARELALAEFLYPPVGSPSMHPRTMSPSIQLPPWASDGSRPRAADVEHLRRQYEQQRSRQRREYIAAAAQFGVAVAEYLEDIFEYRCELARIISGHRLKPLERTDLKRAARTAANTAARQLASDLARFGEAEWMRATQLFRLPKEQTTFLPELLQPAATAAATPLVNLLLDYGFEPPIATVHNQNVFMGWSGMTVPGEERVHCGGDVWAHPRQIRLPHPISRAWVNAVTATQRLSGVDIERLSEKRAA